MKGTFGKFVVMQKGHLSDLPASTSFGRPLLVRRGVGLDPIFPHRSHGNV